MPHPKIVQLQTHPKKFQTEAAYLECHLSCEDKFVLFKQSTCGVDKHRECDTIDQIDDAHLDFLCRLSSVDGFLEHHVEGLTSKQQRINRRIKALR